MNHIENNIDDIIENIMSGLKDFQQATVEHIDSLYRSGQKRILVSDEVGLGKTLIAKALVAKLAKLRMEENDNLFKVIYICSNSSIAVQNIRKLRITPKARIESSHGSRLSMQHLHIFRQENDPELLENYIQLIPLTPGTSFHMTSGGGASYERALLYAILRRLPELKSHQRALEVLMMGQAPNSWKNWAKQHYETKVIDCDHATNGKYLAYMVKQVSQHLMQEDGVLYHALIDHLKKIEDNNFTLIKSGNILGQIRMMFAHISIDLLNPDFVIMDEFQRFKYLIESDSNSEIGMLARRFFNGDDVRMLMLSATPYKMYSTLEEIDELSIDEHYSEFFNVIHFLNPNEVQQNSFKEIWHNYSIMLRSFSQGDNAFIQLKQSAEDALYQVISRTERISSDHMADMIDDCSTRTYLMPEQSDVKSFLEMQRLLDKTIPGLNVPIDYIKSSPYLMSFMREYKLKKQLEKYFGANPNQLNQANKQYLWINRNQIEKFKPIEPANARLKYVQELAFRQNAEKLLWVPPSKPYYELSGPFQGTDSLSKILVFSSWTMVPRMLASLISYESERKNAQVLAQRNQQHAREVRYFSSGSTNYRYPKARLNFSSSLNEPKGMPLFCLLYPSQQLIDCYDPIDCLNQKLTLLEIEDQVSEKIKQLLGQLDYPEELSGREDDRWYYMAPLLIDDYDYVSNWLDLGEKLAEYVDEESDPSHKSKVAKQKGFMDHIERLRALYLDPQLNLGRKPDDLLEVLTNMTMASPAICTMRTYQNIGGTDFHMEMPSQLAKLFINRMNTPESTAVIEVVYGQTSDDAHWKNLLNYCKSGNLQAVFDEYAHILVESNGLANVENRIASLHNLVMSSMNVHTATYTIDTYNSFKGRINSHSALPVNIRSHYCVAFTKSDGKVIQGTDRRETIRNSFNSPFRPFVLATTSIGQEGLDFHYYCRKIVHWNLPSNPVDIEQREGRINRYKCLAIRQNIAKRYGEIDFERNIWHEMFSKAHQKEKSPNGSDLIPFWGLTPTKDMIKIERIIPMYPFSREVAKYDRLIKILSLYRLTLGQPRQEELLQHLFTKHNDEQLRQLFINLSPFYKSAKTEDSVIKQLSE